MRDFSLTLPGPVGERQTAAAARRPAPSLGPHAMPGMYSDLRPTPRPGARPKKVNPFSRILTSPTEPAPHRSPPAAAQAATPTEAAPLKVRRAVENDENVENVENVDRSKNVAHVEDAAKTSNAANAANTANTANASSAASAAGAAAGKRLPEVPQPRRQPRRISDFETTHLLEGVCDRRRTVSGSDSDALKQLVERLRAENERLRRMASGKAKSDQRLRELAAQNRALEESLQRLTGPPARDGDESFHDARENTSPGAPSDPLLTSPEADDAFPPIPLDAPFDPPAPPSNMTPLRRSRYSLNARRWGPDSARKSLPGRLSVESAQAKRMSMDRVVARLSGAFEAAPDASPAAAKAPPLRFVHCSRLTLL